MYSIYTESPRDICLTRGPIIFGGIHLPSFHCPFPFVARQAYISHQNFKNNIKHPKLKKNGTYMGKTSRPKIHVPQMFRTKTDVSKTQIPSPNNPIPKSSKKTISWAILTLMTGVSASLVGAANGRVFQWNSHGKTRKRLIEFHHTSLLQV